MFRGLGGLGVVVVLVAAGALAGTAVAGVPTDTATGGVSQPAASQAAAACKRAKALQDLGRRNEAEAAYLEDLKTAAGLECATEGLTALGNLPASCKGAEALDDVGQKAKAEEAFEKIVALDPGSKCARKGLEDERDSTGFWEWMGTASKDAGAVLGFIVFAGLILLLLVLGLLQLLTRAPKLKRVWPAKRFLQPTLTVAALEDSASSPKMGHQVAGLVRGKIDRGHGGGVDLVKGETTLAKALEPLSDVSAEAKGAVSVIAFLFDHLPNRKFALEGELQPPGAKGCGASVSLSGANDYLEQTALWATECELPVAEKADTYQRLATPVAAWTNYTLARRIGGGAPLLSDDARSWALAYAALAWQEENAEDKAKAVYERALAIDAGNVMALANLGVIEFRERNYPMADKHLRRALAELEAKLG